MGMVRLTLKMEYTLKEGLEMALLTAKMGYLCALMGRSTEVSFIRILFKDKEIFFIIRLKWSIKVRGRKTSLMEKVRRLIRIAANIMGNL